MARPRKQHPNVRHEMTFPPSMLAWLRMEAARQDLSVNEIVRQAVLRLMEQAKP